MKKLSNIFVLLGIVLTLVFIPQSFLQAAITTPTAFWNLDESSGTAADATGNGNTLTNNNTVTYSTGLISNAAYFVGASSQSLSKTDSANFEPGSSDFTIGGWFFTDTGPGYSSIEVSKYSSTVSAQRSYNLDMQVHPGAVDSYIQFKTSGNGSTQQGTNYAGTLFAASTWYHIVVVKTGTTAKIYKNGTLFQTDTDVAGTIFNGTAAFSIGNDGQGTNMTGRADMQGWWNGTALSAADVTALYNAGVGLQFPFPGAAASFVPWQMWDY